MTIIYEDNKKINFALEWNENDSYCNRYQYGKIDKDGNLHIIVTEDDNRKKILEIYNV